MSNYNLVVLFAKGVFLRDLEYDSNKLIENNKPTLIEYNKIPNKFINLESWLMKVNTKCFNCSYTYDSPPVFIPDYFMANCEIAIHKKLFCCFPCAKSHIISIYSGHELQTMLHKLNHVYTIFTGTTPVCIPCAIPLFDNKEFGGDDSIYTVEDFIRITRNLVPPKLYLI